MRDFSLGGICTRTKQYYALLIQSTIRTVIVLKRVELKFAVTVATLLVFWRAGGGGGDVEFVVLGVLVWGADWFLGGGLGEFNRIVVRWCVCCAVLFNLEDVWLLIKWVGGCVL